MKRRWYSLSVLEDPPGPPDYPAHHPDCPCCRLRRRVEAACRSAYGMRGAGLCDETIDRELRREGFGPWERELALQFADQLGVPPNTFTGYPIDKHPAAMI